LVLALPAIAVLLGASHSGNKVLLSLAVLNATIYERLYSRNGGPRLALHLLLLSLATLVAGLPQQWFHSFVTEFSRAELIGVSAVGYVLMCVALSRNPKLGILGAAVALIAMWAALGWDAYAANWAAQVGLAFLLEHSLRWSDAEHAGAKGVRLLLCLVWVMHALFWMRTGGSAWMACAIVAPVLAVCLALRLLRGHWGPRLVPLAAVLVACSGPVDACISRLQTAPLGILALAGSILLFAVGTIAAVTKPQWRRESPLRGASR